jgi:hypothetical protein
MVGEEYPFIKELEEFTKRMQDVPSLTGIFKNPIPFIRFKWHLFNVKRQFKKSIPTIIFPKIKLRYVYIKNGATRYNKKKIIMGINPKIKPFDIRWTISHELMHCCIGPDFDVGKTLNPQYCRNWDKEYCYQNCNNSSLRMRLCCYLGKNVKAGKINKLLPLEEYNDPFLKGGQNGYTNFEEILVEYATLKLWGIDKSQHPRISKIFAENYDEKNILESMNNDLPNLQLAISTFLKNH